VRYPKGITHATFYNRSGIGQMDDRVSVDRANGKSGICGGVVGGRIIHRSNPRPIKMSSNSPNQKNLRRLQTQTPIRSGEVLAIAVGIAGGYGGVCVALCGLCGRSGGVGGVGLGINGRSGSGWMRYHRDHLCCWRGPC
jgi:hypothetical protein